MKTNGHSANHNLGFTPMQPSMPQPGFVRIEWRGPLGTDAGIYPADQKDSMLAYLEKRTCAQVVSVTKLR